MSDMKKWDAETDQRFIARNISAGDCAGLLAIHISCAPRCSSLHLLSRRLT